MVENELADVLTDELTEAVGRAVRAAVEEEVLPRWRRLAEDEVTTKTGSHDLVTVADQRAERQLADALAALLPGSAVVGEEGVHAHPASYQALAQEAPVWIIDPVDGTRQFVAGEEGFCTMVALAQRGETYGAWIHAPALGRTAVARRGRGALLNGAPLHAGSPSRAPPSASPSPTPTSPTSRRSAPCDGCARRTSRPDPPARRAWSTWPSRPGTSTRSPTAGKPPGTTPPGC